MAWQPKIGRHVHYITPSGRLRTARITAVSDSTHLNVKTYKGAPLGVKTRHDSVAVSGTRADKWRKTF
jgi:hypothetical protein